MTNTTPLDLRQLDTSGWQKTKFYEVCRNLNVAVRDPLTSGFDRYVGLEHLEPGNLHIRSWGNVADGTTFTKTFKAGQVLFGKRRAYQRKVAVAEFAGICSGDILVFEANPDVIEPRLLPFLVQSDAFFQIAVDTSAGSLSPRTRFQDLAHFEFRLPPLAEQGQFAELLWAADEVVERYGALGGELDYLRIVLRENEVEHSIYQRIPLGTQLSSIVAGKSLNGINTPALTHTEKAVLKISAVSAEGFVFEENKLLVDQTEFIPELAVSVGDLLITRANTSELVGRVCLVDADHPNLMLSDKTLKLEVNEDTISKPFLIEALKSNHARSQISGMATGTGSAMKNISQSDIRNLRVPFPPKEIQDNIARKFSEIRRQKNAVLLIISTTNQVKSALINAIFPAVGGLG